MNIYIFYYTIIVRVRHTFDKENISVARVLANKTEGGVSEESANFMLSNFDLVPAVEVNHFLGTQGVSLRIGRMEKRLSFEEINIPWTGDSVESEVAIGLILIGELFFNALQIH